MTTTPKRDAATDLAQTFADYVPSLEGRDIVAIRPSLRPDDRRRGAARRGRRDVPHHRARQRRPPGRRGRGVARRRRRRRRRRPPRLRGRVARHARPPPGEATSSAWRACCRTAPASSPCSSRSTAASRSASRATSTSRWLGGAPLLPRGLGRQAGVRGARDDRPAARGGRADHPLELPAADGGLEDRAGPRLREHGGAEAGRDHAAHRAAAGRAGRRRRASRRAWSTSSPAPGSTGAALAAPPGARQGGLHRLHRRGAGDPARSSPAPAGGSRWSSAARAPTWCSTTPPSTRRSRASWTASSSTRATSAAPARACWRRRAIADDLLERLRRRIELLRVGEPLDKNTDVGAINSAAQLERIRVFVDEAAAEGCRIDQPSRAAPRARVLLPAHHRQRPRRRRARSPARRSSGRCWRCRPSAPRPRPSRRPTPPATACRRASGPRRARASSGCRSASRPASSGPTRFNQFDPASPFGGVRESGFGREGGRQGLQEYLSHLAGGGVSDRLAVRKTYKLFIGGAFPRSESGRTFPVTAPDGTLLAHVAARLAQGRPRRRARRPRRPGRLGGPHGLQPGPDPLPRRRGAGGPRRPARRRAGGGGRRPPARRAPTWRRRSTRRSTGRGSPTSSTSSSGAVNPVAGPVPQPLDARCPIGVCALACPDGGGVAGVLGLVLPGDHGRQRRRGARGRTGGARHQHPRGGGRDLGRPRRRREPADRRRRRRCCPGWPTTRTWT